MDVHPHHRCRTVICAAPRPVGRLESLLSVAGSAVQPLDVSDGQPVHQIDLALAVRRLRQRLECFRLSPRDEAVTISAVGQGRLLMGGRRRGLPVRVRSGYCPQGLNAPRDGRKYSVVHYGTIPPTQCSARNQNG